MLQCKDVWWELPRLWLCTAVLMRGRYIYVANVGDSRAVVSEAMPDGSVVARDLSSDQTPYRQDELQRVRACGAVVLTLDQLEGIKDPTIDCWTNELDDDGDPPRLWLPDNMFPGTAFTRSLGDGIAERIGVFAEPEVLIKRLTPRHRYIVIASDGVFEFMPSQKVVDVVSKFADLEEACVAVCSEAYRLWLCNETRTDDITIILLEISGLDDDGVEEEDVLITSPPGGVSGAIGHHSGSGTVFLPVDGNPSEESTVDLAALARPISKEEEDVLNQVALSNIVLADLTPEERAAVYSVVQKYDIKAGDAVISGAPPAPRPLAAAPSLSAARPRRSCLRPEAASFASPRGPHNHALLRPGPRVSPAAKPAPRSPLRGHPVVAIVRCMVTPTLAISHQAPPPALSSAEGEPGTGFFIVKKGRLSVLMAPEPGAKTELVHTYVVEPGQVGRSPWKP